MPFSNGDALSATDFNNLLRGVKRDNTTYSVTGTTNETNCASFSMTGGTMGATGAIHIVASGTITNSAGGDKTVRLYLGATAVATISRTGANAQDWRFDAWCFNTASNAQRWTIFYSTTDAATVTADYTTSAIDTSATATVKVTGQLANSADTIAQTIYDIFVVQIT